MTNSAACCILIGGKPSLSVVAEESKGVTDIAEYLKKEGVNIDDRDEDSRTLLHW